MIKTIIAKEFLNNILNLRFIVGLILCVITTVACIVILTHDYKQELGDYNIRVNWQDEFVDNYAHRNRVSWMIRPQKPPERFRPLIVGIVSNVDLESFDNNSLPTLFPPLDFLFIVTIIMSLLAILFSYDSITGERQNGTLRLLVANSLPRAKILFGKLVGGTASLLIPFVFALLVGAIYISINPNIQWGGSAWSEFVLLIAASVTFIVIFYLLGLMVSTFSKHSSTSVLNCLFLWVLLILVVPNLCPYISAQLYRIPSIKEIEMQQEEIDRTDWKRRKQCLQEVANKFKSDYGKLFSEFESMKFGGFGVGQIELKYREAAQQRAAADPKFKAMMDAFCDEFDRALDPIFSLKDVESNKIWKNLEKKAALQTKLAKNLACISPFANFVYLATDLTGTGLRSLDYFKRFNREYRGEFFTYIDKVEQDAMENDPTYNSNTFVDIRNRPRFVFKEEPLKDKLNAVLPYWGILVLFNVLFFVMAFVGFLRYDVR